MKFFGIALLALTVGNVHAQVASVLEQVPENAECFLSTAGKWKFSSNVQKFYVAYQHTQYVSTVTNEYPVKFRLRDGSSKVVVLRSTASESELEYHGLANVVPSGGPNNYVDPMWTRLADATALEINSVLTTIGKCN